MSEFALFLLGAPRLERDGKAIEMDTRKALALLAYLAVSASSQSRPALTALLWPEYDDAGGRGAFRRTLSTLNRALGGGLLQISRETISLAPQANLWVDVHHFHSLLAACQLHPHPKQEVCPDCLPVLQQAAARYQGDFMAGFTLRDSVNFDDWQFFQTETLRQELAGVLERLAGGQAAAADYEAGIHTARRWLALDALREEAHRQLMQLYEWSGQHGAALRQYRECVRVLDQQLGVPPLDETTRLHQSILEHRLPAPAARAGMASTVPEKPAPPGAGQAGSPPGKSESESYPFVGRDEDVRVLWQAYQSTRTDGAFFALQGEAGIGKTRLAQEFLASVQTAGAVTIMVRCYEGEAHLAYAPVIEALRAALRSALARPEGLSRLNQITPAWLAEAARLLPELAQAAHLPVPPLPPVSDSPAAQSHFLEGLSQVLAGLCQGSPAGILFFDDLHWADNATLDLLTYLVRRLAGRPVFILAAWRDDQTPAGHALQSMLAEARRAGRGGLITLKRLERPAVDALVRAALVHGEKPSEPMVARIFHEAEGLPFFVIEYLKAFQAAGSHDMPDWELPPSGRDLLIARLERAGETGQQLLASAAVIGRSFEYDILRAASGRSELEIVDGLDHLMRLGLIQEQPSQTGQAGVAYDFTHDKIRSQAYGQISLARRRLLHQRAGDAYAAAHRQRQAAGALAAYHYQLAGQPARAAEYFKQAGEYSRAVYANREAAAHFQSALDCGHPQPGWLHEAIGDLHTLAGEYQAALVSYETAAALSPPERLPWIEHRLGIVHHQRGDWELAECHFEAAARSINQEQAPEEKARVFADWSRTAYRRSNYPQARELAQRALELAETSGNLPALAQAQNMLGILARSRDDYPLAVQHLQRSLEITRALNDPGGQAAALNNLARVFAEGGDQAKAIELTGKALELCLQQGDHHRSAALHNNLADLYHATGETQAAMHHLKQAVAAFAGIGLEAGQQKPEIWMLTEW